jgi:S-adenosylmethionine/arginine decarboxylase-like enzyme
MLDHKHLIVRADVQKHPHDTNQLKQWLIELVNKIDMKLATKIPENPIAYYCDDIGNRGMTGVAIIETSHVALHSWDEETPGLIQLDIYSCAPFSLEKVFEHFSQFDPVRISYKFLDRNKDLKEIKE